MGILGFGNAKKLTDLKVKDLRKERLRQEVEQDQLVTGIRRAQDQHDGYLDAASEPGVGDGEIEIASYQMDRALKRKTKHESDLQQVITRIQVIDSTVDVLEQKKELEKKGVWNTIAEMDEDKLQEQLESFAIAKKEGVLGVNKIAEMLEVDNMDVKANRSAGFRTAKSAIEAARAAKTGN